MRVLLDATGIEGRYGGVSRYAVNLARRLPTRAPDDAFLVLTSRDLPRDHPLRQLDDRDNVETGTLRTPALGPRRQVALGLELRRRVREERVDLVHTLRTEAPLYQPVPTVVTLHDLKYLADPAFILGLSRLKTAYLRWALRVGAGRARKAIAVSGHTRDDAVRFLDLDPADVEVTHLASEMAGDRDADAPAADAPPAEDLERPYFLWIGSFLPHKNLPNVLRAFASYARGSGPAGGEPDAAAQLALVAGPGHRQRECMRLAEELGVRSRVVHLHSVSDADLRRLYRGAEALLFVSRYEGFGIPVLEAMEFGTPAITSATTATAEVAGDAGLLVDPEDPEAIAEAMRRVRSSPELRDRLARDGRQRAGEFSWEQTAEATYRVYRDVATD